MRASEQPDLAPEVSFSRPPDIAACEILTGASETTAPLSELNHEKLCSLWRLIGQASDCRLLYRGETLERMRSHLGFGPPPTYPGADEVALILQRLFVVGQKARSFFEMGSEHRDRLAKDFPLPPLSDAEAALPLLFDRLSLAMRRGRAGEGSKGLQRWVIAIDEKAPEVGQFFDETRREEFLKQSADLSAESARAIRDYYACLLHTLGRAGLVQQSYVVSAAEEEGVTEGFARSDGHTTPIKIVAWAPDARLPWTGDVMNGQRDLVASAGFPVIDEPAFPEQSERSFIGALFPDFILGVSLPESGRFIVNPRLARHSGSALDLAALIQTGFHVDFAEFDRVRAYLAYERVLLRSADGAFHEFDAKTLEPVDA